MTSNQVSITSAMASGARHGECSECIGHREWAEQAVLRFAKQWIPQDNKKKVKTMELLKKAVTVKGKAIYDVVTLFSRLLVVGQQHSVDSRCLPVWTKSNPSGPGHWGILSLSLPWLHVLQTWCWLMPVTFCTTSSGQSQGLPGCKLRHSTGPLPSCLQENHSVRQIWPRCSQRKWPWADEKRKSQGSTSNPKHLHSMPRRSYSSQFQEQEST